MGSPSSGAADQIERGITGSFDSATTGTAIELRYDFNVAVWGTFVGTVAFECSFDGGTTWIPCAFSDGTTVSFTAPMAMKWSQPEAGVLYRLECTSYTSGTISWRLSR